MLHPRAARRFVPASPLLLALVLAPTPSHGDEPRPGSRKAALVAAVREADTLYVGEDWTDDDDDLVILRGTSEIQRVLDRIEIDDARSGWRCRCIGSPGLAFCRGEHLLAEVRVHHGFGLSGLDGWDANSQLTEESERELHQWLYEIGWIALEARERRAAEILTRDVWGVIRREKGSAARRAAFERAFPDPMGRRRTMLRLYGSHAGSWNLVRGIDLDLGPLLSAEEPSELVASLVGHANDEDLVLGLARHLVHDRSAADARAITAGLGDALPVLWRLALVLPRVENRREAMAALAEAGGTLAVGLLREVLVGGPAARPLPDSERVQPPARFLPRRFFDTEVQEATSDRTAAAWLLATQGDSENRASIEALLETADERDRWIVRAALEIFGK